ncbi:MAG TPA: hydroxymethylglutaryl-CoA lyase [Marinobacter sp.]|nr:hydroxymethylglutaryl-CoA lyase [Marinobacter sp.]
MTRVAICDVALRDGLQSQKEFLTTSEKLAVLRAMEKAGIREFELGSFVRPDRVPQMADTVELFSTAGRPAGSTYIGLTPNTRGLRTALEVGANKVAIVVTCTDALSERNFGKTVDLVLEEARAMVAMASSAGARSRIYVSGIFECPFEGAVTPERVVEVAGKVSALGPSEVCLADTTGAGNPQTAEILFAKVLDVCPADQLAVHLHDTRGMAMAMAWVAYKAGIRKFDSSLGGLGGCPFAPGASGNVATEDLVVMFEQAGVSTGIDGGKLLQAVEVLEASIKRPVGGRTINWLKSRKRK